MKKKSLNEIINNYKSEYNNLLCDIIDEIQEQGYDVGQREVSNLASMFEKELTYWWARQYYADELFRFAYMHPEEARDEDEIRKFLDTLLEPDVEEDNSINDYLDYVKEVQDDDDYHMSGPCKMCGMTETDRDIRTQPINPERLKKNQELGNEELPF